MSEDLALYHRVRSHGMPPSPKVPPWYEQVVHCVGADPAVSFRDALLAACVEEFTDHPEEEA